MNYKNAFNLNPDTVIVASPRQRASLLNEEMVVLNLDNEQYYVFNESATAVWSHLSQPICLGMLANVDNVNEAELKAFLLDLVDAGLLIESESPAIAREIDLSLAAKPILTCMGGMKELVAMAGSAGGTDVGEEDPGTEGIEDTTSTSSFEYDSLFSAAFFNDRGVGDDATGRPEDPNPFLVRE